MLSTGAVYLIFNKVKRFGEAGGRYLRDSGQPGQPGQRAAEDMSQLIINLLQFVPARAVYKLLIRV